MVGRLEGGRLGCRCDGHAANVAPKRESGVTLRVTPTVDPGGNRPSGRRIMTL
jgi:hypothetical protein